MEMNEPTYDNILSEIDSVLERGYGYCFLIGAIAEGTPLLCSDLDVALPLAEIVPIQSEQDVHIGLSVNTLGESMHLLLYGHHSSASELGTNSPVNPISHPVVIEVLLRTHRIVVMMIARMV